MKCGGREMEHFLGTQGGKKLSLCSVLFGSDVKVHVKGMSL